MLPNDQAAAPEPAPGDGPAAVSVPEPVANLAPSPDAGPLDELALRRPDFEEGYPVVLADGQAWHFRRPRVYFQPADNATGFTVGFSNGADPEIQRLRRQLDDLGARPLIADLAPTELTLAAHALRQNYTLTGEQLAALLHFAYDEMGDSDTDAVRIRDEVMAVLNGDVGPKPPAGGAG